MFLYMQAHAHTPHLLTCSKDWIKSHGWQSGVAALQRQAKPSCIKPEHRAPWAWPVKCYHTHLPGERPAFITHIRWWLSGPVHLRPEQVSWFRFCHRCFIFFGKNCWSKMLLAHQQACHSLPVTSIRVSVDPGCLAMCLSTRTESSFPFHCSSPLWMSCSPTPAGRQGTGATEPHHAQEKLEGLQDKGVSEATSFILSGFAIKADSRQCS